MRSGNLLLYGVVGSGTTTALSTIAVAFGRGGDPAARHLYVLAGSADLAPLERLPHCAGVVRPADRDRQIRVLRRLVDELDRRRREDIDRPGELPTILIVVDNLEGFRTAFEDSRDAAFWDQFTRIYSEGPEVGIYTVGAVTRIGGIPAVLSTATTNKVLFRLADAVDYGSIGINRANLPTFVPGRAIMARRRTGDPGGPTSTRPGPLVDRTAAMASATAARSAWEPFRNRSLSTRWSGSPWSVRSAGIWRSPGGTVTCDRRPSRCTRASTPWSPAGPDRVEAHGAAHDRRRVRGGAVQVRRFLGLRRAAARWSATSWSNAAPQTMTG